MHAREKPRCQPGPVSGGPGGPSLRPHFTTGDTCRQVAFYAQQSDEMPQCDKFTTLREEDERAAWAAELE